MKFFNDGYRFLKIIQNYMNLDVVKPNKHIYNEQSLGTNIGLYTALVTALTSIINILDTVCDKGKEIDSCDEKDAQKSATKFQKIMNKQTFQELKYDENTLQTRNELYNMLKKSKFLFYKIQDVKNPAFKNLKNYPYILINKGKKSYVNLDNKDLTGYKYNHDHLTTTQVKDILKEKGHTIGQDFQIKENPNASDDIDMPRILSINGIKFFYNPDKLNSKYIIYANIPYLSNDQDSYDAFSYNKNLHSLYIE